MNPAERTFFHAAERYALDLRDALAARRHTQSDAANSLVNARRSLDASRERLLDAYAALRRERKREVKPCA